MANLWSDRFKPKMRIYARDFAFLSTKIPTVFGSSSSQQEVNPVNYEYLVCRNKKHIRQGHHCNPDRVYALQHKWRGARESNGPKSPPPTPIDAARDDLQGITDGRYDDGTVTITTTTNAWNRDHFEERGIPFERVEVRGMPGPWIVSSVHKTIAEKGI